MGGQTDGQVGGRRDGQMGEQITSVKQALRDTILPDKIDRQTDGSNPSNINPFNFQLLCPSIKAIWLNGIYQSLTYGRTQKVMD